MLEGIRGKNLTLFYDFLTIKNFQNKKSVILKYNSIEMLKYKSLERSSALGTIYPT